MERTRPGQCWRDTWLYGLVKQSENYVRIYSEPGQGTRFKLYLPRHRGDADGQAEAEGAAGASPRGEVGETTVREPGRTISGRPDRSRR